MKRAVFILALSLLPVFLSAQDYAESVKRLEEHVSFLSSASMEGRMAGSEGERKAAEYMYDCLSEAGVTMLCPRSGQEFSIVMNGDTVRSRNVVGLVEGYDEALRHQYVVVGTNIDHLGVNTLTVNGKNVMQIFPGAYDNASGMAAVIAVAERVAASGFFFRRSVVFAGFGAKELGTAGSWYFVNRAFGDTDSISVMLDVRMVGKYGPDHPFLFYTGISSPEINRYVYDLSEAGVFYIPDKGEGVLPFGDYLPFYERNIPVMLLTTCSDRYVRTVRDEAGTLEYGTLESVCDFIYNFVMKAANADMMIDRPEVIEDTVSAEMSGSSGDRVYNAFEVDLAPQYFKGDVQSFLEDWVYTYLKYPDIPLSQGVSGTVTVEFIVEKDGRVTNVRAVRGNDQYLEDEAVRVISASPKWKPGVLGGEKVRVKISVPVEFRLRKR